MNQAFLEISSFRLFYVYANCDRIVTTFCLFRRKVETKRSKRTILLVQTKGYGEFPIAFCLHFIRYSFQFIRD